MKRIVECASDRLWGTGVPLGDPNCLDPTKWISQGILGQILECIREEAVNSGKHFYHQPRPAIGISTTSILDDPIATDSTTSAFTTPTSDTTASDTDPGDSQSHYQKSSPMENMHPSSNST